MSSTSTPVNFAELIPAEVWDRVLILAFNHGLRELFMYICTCKGVRLSSVVVVTAVKQAFPHITNWPDRSEDADGGAAFLLAMARRYFTAPASMTMTGVSIHLHAALQSYGMVMFRQNAAPPVVFFEDRFRRFPFPAILHSNAGRKLILQAIEDGTKDGVLFGTEDGVLFVGLGSLPQIVRDIVRHRWAVTRNAAGELVIGGFEPDNGLGNGR